MTPRTGPAGEPGGAITAGYGVSIALCLPRDELSVPVVRRLVGHALEQVGVRAAVLDDLLLALSEACSNVLDHAGPSDAYDVRVQIGPEHCELRIVDVGRGFDHTSLTTEPGGADPHAEQGRGLGLMHALVDQVELRSEPESGTLVRLVKTLEFDETAPARRLLRQGVGAAGPQADKPSDRLPERARLRWRRSPRGRGSR